MDLITSFICMKKNIGVHDNLFGGILLAKLDEAGATLAMQACDEPRMVTLKINEVLFKKPVKVGNLIKIYGEVTKIGNTSITLNIEARKHNVQTSKEKVVCFTSMTFVRIDIEGEAVPISDKVRNRYKDLQ